MSKLGVFLGFQPGVNLSNEGIGRLLAFILKEQNKDDFGVVLFCPEWLNDSVTKLLKDNKVNIDKCEVVSTKKIPFGVRIKKYLLDRRKGSKKISSLKILSIKVKNKINVILNNVVAEFMSTSSWFMLFLKSIIYLIIALVISPVILFFVFFFIASSVLRILMSKIISQIQKLTIVNSLLRDIKQIETKSRGRLYQVVLDNELYRIVKLINKRSDIKTCYIPSMAWPQIKAIRCKKVLAAPDILFYDFPTQYSDTIVAHKRIRMSIDSADHLICYSDFVKFRHLVDKCGIDENKISVIKHANIDMKEHLKLSKSMSKYLTDTQNAKLIINEYIKTKFSNGNVFYNSNISQMNYVIYSSQARPHKNIFNLIKAIKIMNKDNYMDVKLILTGDINQIDFMQDYIRKHHLENDVFVLYGISSEVLAAFNQMAVCAVNPTLFEGGFPFTFSEAYSVGTPSVMSNIPVVANEIKNESLKEKMLFDPFNPYSIAQKIIWAVNNSTELYKAQAELYSEFDKRDWKVVVGEYNRVFKKFMI